MKSVYTLSERCRPISVHDRRPLVGFKIREVSHHFDKHFTFSSYLSLTLVHRARANERV